MKPKSIALLCSDIHLSLNSPICRGLDRERWFETMAHYLKKLKDIAKDHAVPIVCAGDVFDKWNSPPELINFALKHLPEMYAILPNHNLQN